MSYLFDKNGNRTTMTYPNGVAVDQTFDFADRPKSSTLRDGATPPQPLASNALYEPFGPLNALTLLSEESGFAFTDLPNGAGQNNAEDRNLGAEELRV